MGKSFNGQERIKARKKGRGSEAEQEMAHYNNIGKDQTQAEILSAAATAAEVSPLSEPAAEQSELKNTPAEPTSNSMENKKLRTLEEIVNDRQAREASAKQNGIRTLEEIVRDRLAREEAEEGSQTEYTHEELQQQLTDTLKQFLAQVPEQRRDASASIEAPVDRVERSAEITPSPAVTANQESFEERQRRWHEKLAKSRGPAPSVAPSRTPKSKIEKLPVDQASKVAEVQDALGEESVVAEPVPAPAERKPGETAEEHEARVKALVKEDERHEEAGPQAEYLAERSKELDAEAENKFGPLIMSGIRAAGERYNKLHWGWKLAIGASLGVGASGLAVAAPWAMTAAWWGIGAQRAAGTLGMFTKFEKQLQEASEGTSKGFLLGKREWYQKYWKGKTENQRTLAAGLMAATYTAGATFGIRYAVHHAPDALQWLREHYSSVHSGTTAESIPTASAVASAPTPETINGMSVVPPEVDVNGMSMQLEVPDVSVNAASGHGYEYMAKQLWKQLHENHNGVTPADLNPDSDYGQLLNANEKTIGKVVHDLATKHGFFNPNGTSVLIDPHSSLTLGADGQLHIADSMHHIDVVQAPEHAPTTPAHHPHATHVAHTTHAPIHHPEASHVEHPESWFIEHESPDYTTSVTHPHAPIDIDGHTIDHSVTTPESHASTEAPLPEQTAHEVIKPLEIPVNLNETHGYLNTNGQLYVLGGDKALIDVQAQEYALKHHVSVFVDKSYKLLGLINTPRFVEYVPNPDGTLIQVIHNGPSYVPDLKQITKQVF